MYNVEVVNRNNSAFTVLSEGHEFTIDTKGGAISPMATLLASLGSCIGVYIRKYAEGAKLELNDFCIKVGAKFEKKPNFHFKEILVSIDLRGLKIEEGRKKALLNFVKNCPIHNTLKADPAVNIEII